MLKDFREKVIREELKNYNISKNSKFKENWESQIMRNIANCIPRQAQRKPFNCKEGIGTAERWKDSVSAGENGGTGALVMIICNKN